MPPKVIETILKCPIGGRRKRRALKFATNAEPTDEMPGVDLDAYLVNSFEWEYNGGYDFWDRIEKLAFGLERESPF